jgi:hypothetical protein
VWLSLLSKALHLKWEAFTWLGLRLGFGALTLPIFTWIIGTLMNKTKGHLPMLTGSKRNRAIALFQSTERRRVARVVARSQAMSNKCPEDPIFGQVEMDSHADTCVLGKNFIIFSSTGRECDVYPYTDSYDGIKGVQIVSGATSWTCQQTGETFILVVHEALWMPDSMAHSLVNPNQLRAFGSTVQDNPFGGAMSLVDPEEVVTIPMKLDGTNVGFKTRTPTQDELDDCQHIHLSSQHEWDPSNMVVPRYNLSAVDTAGVQAGEDDDEAGEEIYNPVTFCQRLISSCQVHRIPEKRQVQEVLTDVKRPPSFTTEDRRADVSPQDLADRWMIGKEQAKLTLKSTTQRYLRSALLPLARRYKADRMFFRRQLQGEWYTDTVFGPVKSKDGNNCGQIFANGNYFAQFYPMDSKKKAGDSLKVFCREYGVPEILRHDGAKEMVEKRSEFRKQVVKHNIKTHTSEAHLHNQSPAEGVVREIRKKWYRVMFKKRVPQIYWDYGMRWVCEIQSRTHLRAHRINGGVPLQGITGDTVDIANYLEFGFYDRAWYRDNAGLGEIKPGRWLGVAENIGSIMTYYILQQNGQVVARSTVWNPTNLELQTDDVKDTFKAYDVELTRRIGSNDFPMEGDKPDPEQWADLRETDEDFREEFFKVYQDEGLLDAKDDEPSPGIADEQLLMMELALPRHGEDPQLARVKRRKTDHNGAAIGIAHTNPILDTRVFEVEFLDGETAAMTANGIAENLFAQVDQDGHRLLLMDEIIDHRRGQDAVSKDDAFLTTSSGQQRRKPTTTGWDLRIKWKDGAETWTPLKDMKESYMVQTAEYAVQNQLHEEPAFAWWVPAVIKKRKTILSKVKSKYWQKTHKYGIEVPKNIKQAKELDTKNGNTLWWDSICDEMKNVMVAFEVCEGDLPPGYTHINCHMIFDVKLGENYRRKARLVAGGHMTGAPTSITYSSVVSRDSVRICLLAAALNGLDVLACDIKGAYLTAPSREKVATTAGEEFGPELKGKTLLIVRALYGLKSAGAAFRAHLAEHLHSMDYRPSYADPDVWMRPAVKPNGEKYYEYLLAYVDDLLSISWEPMQTMLLIKKKFTLKGDKIAPPEDYLGAVLSKMKTEQGNDCWTQSADKYLAASVQNVEANLKQRGRVNGLPRKSKCSTPFESSYRPELDVSNELALEGHRYFQELIGVLRWGVEIGRLDILLEVSLLSAYLACPREGHLEAAFHIFGYLKHVPKKKIAFDPDYPKINQKKFKKYDWTDFYKDAQEPIPPNAPPPRGKAVSTHCFVDANLAGDTVTRRSQMGILLFVNKAPITWLSKRTNTVESSTFGSELVAMRSAVDLIEGLRYKLRMFGIPIEGPTDIFCDNEAVTKNCGIPESTLQKKHHSIAYHRNREAVAAGTVRIAKEDTGTNLADVFTKLMGALKRENLFDLFMY